MFMLMHAALAVLAARLAGTEDIAIGTPVAGRGEAELDHLVGMFVNTLVSANTDHARRVVRGRPRPGSRRRPRRVPAHRFALRKILIEFRNNALPQLELPGLSVSGVEFDLPVAKFDLQLSVTERYDADGGTDGIDAEFIYATDLFDGDLIDSFSRRLLTILEAVSREPSTPTGDIDVVSADERRQMLTEWNTHAEPAPADNIADRFFEAVAAHPSSTAVNDSDGAMTYAELDGRANRLARLLIGRGIGPESVVAVAMPRTPDLVLALVAVIKTGAAYLPVDITYPAERMRFLFDDARPVCLVTTGDFRSDLPSEIIESGIDVVELGSPEIAVRLDHSAPHRITDADRTTPLLPDAIAYIIYTSGSTGRPKGVQVSHRNVLTLMDNTAPTFGFDDTDVWTMFHSTHSTSPSGSCGGRCYTAADWSSSTTTRPDHRTCSTNCSAVSE
ncbi:hypothetical protein P4O66_004352 [Electrophorus voltai]|uniref:AMP-dependent synthetase/ligase domain-containing protein n=1 Tax=Electrophorus voltai TaxID=2609070 RepID=A0AAD8YRJ8_9TELE|nr:hypothetical protein P4O66_004352 [Electrophorus voltai]